MRRAATLAIVAALAATGCGGAGDDAGARLTATPWLLAGPAGGPAPAASIEFADDGSVAGSGGCNRFGGGYEVDGAHLTIGQLASTQMACAPAAMKAERRFLVALERVREWRIDGAELVLADDDGAELLRFAAASPEGRWRATSFLQADAVASPLAGTEVTAEFGADGKLSGSAGCNDYHATYTTDGGRIEISGLAATELACPEPAGAMEQELDYLDALPRAASFTVGANSLTLLTESGTIVATYEEIE